MSEGEESFVAGVDGTRLYARRIRGRGALSFVLCDGIACDGFIWRYLAGDLRELGDVVHWNYRGHGRSSAPIDPDCIDADALASDLDAVRRRQNPDGRREVLVGHSLGCQVALEGYRKRPDGVAALVLICGAAGRVTHTFKGSDALAQALPRLIEAVRRNPRLARALWSNVPPEVTTRLALALGEVDAGVSPEDIRRYSEHAANLDLLMFLRMLRAVGEQTAEDMLGGLTVPVLILAGEADSFTPVHLAEEMAATIPNAELVIFPGATHIVPVERREEVRERILSFVRERVYAAD
ncbi:MAG: alpha/beta hydrolase [Myxococcota bacterium]